MTSATYLSLVWGAQADVGAQTEEGLAAPPDEAAELNV